jgi:hypothetical protein
MFCFWQVSGLGFLGLVRASLSLVLQIFNHVILVLGTHFLNSRTLVWKTWSNSILPLLEQLHQNVKLESKNLKMK